MWPEEAVPLILWYGVENTYIVPREGLLLDALHCIDTLFEYWWMFTRKSDHDCIGTLCLNTVDVRVVRI
jgi:hypothetical protein